MLCWIAQEPTVGLHNSLASMEVIASTNGTEPAMRAEDTVHRIQTNIELRLQRSPNVEELNLPDDR